MAYIDVDSGGMHGESRRPPPGLAGTPEWLKKLDPTRALKGLVKEIKAIPMKVKRETGKALDTIAAVTAPPAPPAQPEPAYDLPMFSPPPPPPPPPPPEPSALQKYGPYLLAGGAVLAVGVVVVLAMKRRK